MLDVVAERLQLVVRQVPPLPTQVGRVRRFLVRWYFVAQPRRGRGLHRQVRQDDPQQPPGEGAVGVVQLADPKVGEVPVEVVLEGLAVLRQESGEAPDFPGVG